MLIPSHWFQLAWPSSWDSVDIPIKELVPIVVSAALWGRVWSGSRVCFHTDNMSVVAILQSQSARNPLAHHLVRCLYFYAVLFDFKYEVEHVPGESNSAADALSRNNLTLFSFLLPQARPVSIPPALVQLLVIKTPDWGSQAWITFLSNTLTTR